MSEPSSYLDQEERQGALFSDADIMASVERDETEGRYTSERLASQRPAIYKLVVRLLAEGVPLRQITRATGCHHYTIQQVAAREPRAIEAQKEELGKLGRYAARLCTERILEAVEELPLKDFGDVKSLAIAHGILVERSELLLGGATSRVEHGDAERIEDLRQVFDALPASEPGALKERVLAGGCAGQMGADSGGQADGSEGSGAAAEGFGDGDGQGEERPADGGPDKRSGKGEGEDRMSKGGEE